MLLSSIVGRISIKIQITVCYGRIWHHQFWLATNQEQVLLSEEDKDKSPTVNCGSTCDSVQMPAACFSMPLDRNVPKKCAVGRPWPFRPADCRGRKRAVSNVGQRNVHKSLGDLLNDVARPDPSRCRLHEPFFYSRAKTLRPELEIATYCLPSRPI